MIIYLASRYSRYPEMQKHARKLESQGHLVTSRWIKGDHWIDKEQNGGRAAIHKDRFAREDLEDLIAADTIISFTQNPRESSTSRGGRHVEFGLGLAHGKNLVIIGPRENIFHWLERVQQYDTLAGYLASLAQDDVK